MLIFATLFLFFVTTDAIKTCKTYPGYYLNYNCHDNPDGESEVPEIIRRRGYDVESHNVVTKDGYILTLFHIPSKMKSPPVLILHGINKSSLGWFCVGNDSLAFVLADAGHDVWLGNFRGTRYSQNHKTLNINQIEFWNFSFHELGVYDLRAVLSFLVEKTGKKVRYIGHSMGTTAAYIYAITYPEEAAKNVEIMIHLAPIAYLRNLKSSLAKFAFLTPVLVPPLNATFKGVLFKQTPLYQYVYRKATTSFPFQMKLFLFLMMTEYGFDYEQVNVELLPVQILHSNDATSIKTLKHYADNINSQGKFLYYDHGKEGNLQIYGAESPPSYNLSRIRVPLYLIYGQNDILGSKENVMRLYKDLPEDVKKHGMWTPKYKKFNHQDFLVAKDVKNLLYGHINDFLNKL